MPPKRIKKSASYKPPTYSQDEDAIPPTYPWPRPEGREIDLADRNIPDSSEDRWDKEDSRRYNALLNITIKPTRFVNAETLNQLGLHQDIHAVLSVLGIADLCFVTHYLYSDLVRQVLATAELTYKRPHLPTFEEAYFTFFAGGTKYSISLERLTEVYEISEEYTGTSFPKKFAPEQDFWKFIAQGEFRSHSANQSHIRNPSLRIIAKILSNLLFSKEQTSKVHKGELQMLFAGVEDEIRNADIDIPTAPMTTSPGCVLCQMFVEKRARVLKGTLKTDRSGRW